MVEVPPNYFSFVDQIRMKNPRPHKVSPLMLSSTRRRCEFPSEVLSNRRATRPTAGRWFTIRSAYQSPVWTLTEPNDNETKPHLHPESEGEELKSKVYELKEWKWKHPFYPLFLICVVMMTQWTTLWTPLSWRYAGHFAPAMRLLSYIHGKLHSII